MRTLVQSFRLRVLLTYPVLELEDPDFPWTSHPNISPYLNIKKLDNDILGLQLRFTFK